MPCRERGLALVSVLQLLALLLVIGLMLGEKVLRATRGERLAGVREQAVQAAGTGIEWTRHRLAASYAESSGWALHLTGAPGGERYPEIPVFSLTVGAVPVDIFVRDNPDGDADPRRDSDLKLMVMARARPPGGAPVMVETLCGFDAATAAGYRQSGGDPGRSGQADADGVAAPWAAPADSFHLHE